MRVRGGMARRACWALIAWTSLAGCGAFNYVPPAAQGGTLQVQIIDLGASGHAGTIRGTVSSSFSEPVAGVRYVVTVRDKSDPSKILNRFERQVETAIDPGGQAPVHLDIEGAPFGNKKLRIAIAATPVMLGDRAMPAPAGWSSGN